MLPRTLADRSKVQATRTIGDRRLKRLTVRESTRVRAYVEDQTARIEEAWGRRAEVVAERSREVRRATDSLAGARGVMIAVALLLLFLAFRNAFFSLPANAGDLLPFPASATDLWSSYLSPWVHSGLGHAWPSPPAFGVLGWFSMLTLGNAGAAQKLALLVFGSVAFIGAYRLVGDSVDRIARLVAASVYLLGGVGYAGMRNGHLSALVVGATAPFVLRPFLTLIGWQRPPGFRRTSTVGQAVLAAAIAGSLVPGSLVYFAACASILALVRGVVDRPLRAAAGLGWGLLALALSWALLLPWSLTWFHPGGALDVLMNARSRGGFIAAYQGNGFLTTILGRTPYLPAFAGLGLPVAGLVALFVARGQRFRLAIALWAVVVAVAFLVQATAAGQLVPLVASPIEAGVLASLAFSGLAGIAASAIRLDLKSISLGLRQPLGVGAAVLAGVLAVTGLVPAMVGAGYSLKPAETQRAARMSGAGSLVADQGGKGTETRVLWVGRSWTGGFPTGSRPARDYVITGNNGQAVTDLFETTSGPGETQLRSTVGAIESGRVDLGGNLLGAFNIGWVVVGRGSGASHWLGQRDLTVVRSDPAYDVLENSAHLARAGAYRRLPPQLAAVAGRGVHSVVARQTPALSRGLETSKRTYSIAAAPRARVAFLAESRDPGWIASSSGRRLRPLRDTWGNAFAVPVGTSGDYAITYRRSFSQVAWLVLVGIGWLVAIGVSFARRREHAP
jgi:hypothetical protein